MRIRLSIRTDDLFDPNARHPAPMDDYRLPPEPAEQLPADEAVPPRRRATWAKPPAADDHADLRVMKITQSAYDDMLEYLAPRKPEAAGMLLGPVKDDVLVTHFIPDSEGTGTWGSFHINAPFLNETLRLAKAAGLNCKGLSHSHPAGISRPSSGDLRYLESLFQMPANAEALQCFVPIVCDRRLYPYVYAGGRLWNAELILV